jgi:hypothetical protein
MRLQGGQDMFRVVVRTSLAGLFGALFYATLWTPPAPTPSEVARVQRAPAEQLRVVDVARGIDSTTMASLVPLHDDERVIAIDDHPVVNDLAAGVQIAERARDGRRFIDVTIDGMTGKRRVLVLVH